MAVHQSRASRSPWRLFAVLGLCFLLLASLPSYAALARPAAGSAVDPRFGVVEAWRAPAQADDLGVGWERVTLWWKALQPDGPQSWNNFATGHDGYINREIAAGRQVVGELINTPDWAAADPSQHGNSVPKNLYLPYDDPRNYWGNFVGQMAKRYAGRIDNWIIWNEVNIPSGTYATWKGSVADYARLVEVAYLAAHHANPQARIVLFGDPYWYDHGAFFKQLMALLAKAPDSAANNGYFDAANVHLYNRPRDFITVLPLYQKWMAEQGLSKPIWIGETNAVPYNDPVRLYPRSGFFATLDDQASYIVEAFAIAMALKVERIEVNRMIDGADFIAGGEPFGLLRNDKSRRPEYSAFKTVTTLFKGVTGGTISVNGRTGVYTVVLQKPGSSITVSWNQTPKPVDVHVQAVSQSAIAYGKLGNSKTVTSTSGLFSFALPQSTGNTNPADPHDYVMGGSPVIVVQPQA